MRQYQESPLARVVADGWIAALMIEAETGFLVYGVVSAPDGRKWETVHPYIGMDSQGRAPSDLSQGELIAHACDLLRAYKV